MAAIHCNFNSYALHRPVDIECIIPSLTFSECDQNAPCHKISDSYPVLYLLHGMGQDAKAWLNYSSVARYAEENKIAVVMLSGEKSNFVNTDKYGNYMSFVSEELPEFVCSLFPVSERPADTFIAGLSMGGYGTMMQAFTYPERYAAFGTFSAAITINPEKEPTPPCPEDFLQRSSNFMVEGIKPEYSPALMAEDAVKSGKELPEAFIACGTEDFGYYSNKAFAEYLKKIGYKITWVAGDKFSHEWNFWDLMVHQFIQWIPRTDAYATKEKPPV